MRDRSHALGASTVGRAFVLAALLAPATAAAQAPEEVPAPSEEATTPGDVLGDPNSGLHTPGGYRPAPTVAPGRARVRVLGWGDRSLRLYLTPEGTERASAPQCIAPCGLDVTPGRYALSVEPDGGGPREVDGELVWIDRPGVTIQAGYDHRLGLRALGWVFASLASLAFGLAWIGGVFSALIIGLPIAVAFFVPAVPLIALQDSAQAQITPIID